MTSTTTTNPTLRRVQPRFDPAAFVAAATDVGLSDEVIAAALERLRAGEVIGLAVSGKIASGKDTVAPMVLEGAGFAPVEHLSFAKALKAEFDDIVAVIRAQVDDDLAAREAAVQGITADMAIPREQSCAFVERLFDHVRDDRSLDAYSRTPEIRWGLQFLGTEVRRAQDENYWVKRALRPAVTALAAGSSVFFTDCRFPNEVEGAARVGFLTARLEVSPEVQRERLTDRDGQFDPSAFTHASEVALDDYSGFDVVIDNDGELAPSVAALVDALVAHRDTIAA